MKKYLYRSALTGLTASATPLPTAAPLKKKLLYTLLTCTLLYTPACEMVLDQKPRNEVSEDVAIIDKRGAQAALAGMYNQLQDANYYGRNLQIMSDVSSDQAQSVGTWDFYREMDTYVVDKGNLENGNFWLRAYQAVNVANHVIEKVPLLSDISEEDKTNFIGQAYFVRGLAYFDLTRVYGGVPGVVGTLGVPLVTTPSKVVNDSFFPARATLEASYSHVESDLLQALSLLPEAQKTETASKSQAVKTSARALLSRLYLYTQKPDLTLKYADEVLANSKYELTESYETIFASKFSSEAIFELSYNTADQSGMRTWYFPTSAGGRGDVAVHPGFLAEITADPNDARGKMYALNTASSVYYPTKFNKEGNVDNIPVLRLAEVYLNRAEAKAQLDDLEGALADLNKIRERAGATSIGSTPGKTALLQAIWKERSFELAFEGHSFFDLVRTGQALTKLTNVARKNSLPVSLTSAGRQVFPIPAFDIDANKNLVQNEAYK